MTPAQSVTLLILRWYRLRNEHVHRQWIDVMGGCETGSALVC
jgi:hypothetical protein